MMFTVYQSFLNEPLDKDGKEAYEKFVDYLDSLPSFEVSKEEQDYIDDVSSTFNISTLKKVNEDKINAIENIEEWLKANGNSISQYEVYKNSEEYHHQKIQKIVSRFFRKFNFNHRILGS